ncbi:MAG: leucine-rich repeat domain-containing protein [Clostridia bacterium]|nr:leucine-rich repeat domain-containing protein [Clostridia bacterium]
MKKTVKFLLAVLFCAALISLVACKNGSESSSDAVTRLTVTLVTAGSDGAAVSEEDLGDETEYYSVTGYTFSEADAAIVTNAENDADYYTDRYNGSRKDTDAYKKEKERYEALKSFTVPAAVKVTVSESKLNLTAENLAAMDANGVIDLSGGAENAKTVYIRAIGADAFFNHNELETVAVGETVKAIGSGAFNACANLKSIELPFAGGKVGAVNGAKNFGYVFGTASYDGGVSVTQSYNLSGTATYYIPEDLASVKIAAEIGEYAFHGVTTIKSIENIALGEVIPAYAFNGCTGLKEVTLPAATKEIGEGAFGGCSNLVTVNFSALTSLETIGNAAFDDCSKLCYKEEGKALVIPASVTFVGEGAFEHCTSIEKLTIGAAATVRAKAFSGLSSLKDVTIASGATLSANVFVNWSDFLTVHGSEDEFGHAFTGAYTADYVAGKPIKANIAFGA